MVLEGNILNGQQLINLRLKDANRDLPVIGQKEFQPTKSWLENKQIQSALYDRKSLLEEERVEKWSSLSTAEWLPDIKKAKVTKKVGKVWENFGHHAQDADWLFPEEALLLLETNALELLFNEIPLSIERGYCVLINENSGCTINEYRTFSHLVRLGYKLFRHLAEVSVTRYEKDIHLDQHVLLQKTTYNSKNDNVVITDVTSEVDIVRQDTANNLNVNCDINSANDIVQINVIEESSTNSDICVTNKDKDSVPLNKSKVDLVQDKQSDVVVDEDDDVIEIPIDEETIVVNEISSDSEADVVGTNESSSSEDEEDDDDDSSVTSQTSNSNWKRNQKNNSTKNKQINIVDISNSSSPVPAVAIRTNYLTVNEFLFDPTQIANNINNSKDNHEIIDISDDDIVVDKVTVVDNKNSLGKELQRFYKEIEIIDIDSDPEDLNKSTNESDNISNLTRKDIMNSFPIFKNGIATVINVPPHHLLPPNIKPVSKEYRLNFLTSDSIYNSYNTSNVNRDARESNWSNYNKNHRLQQFNKNGPNVRNVQPQQNFQQAVPSRQYNNRPSYYHNRNRSMFPSSYLNSWNSWPVNDNSVQNQVSQIRAMATGMIQVASTLLSLPFVQQSMPRIPSLFYNQPIQQPFHNNPFNRLRFNNYNNNNNNNNMQPLNQSSCSSNMIITNNNPNFDQSYQHNQQSFTTQVQNYSNYNVSSQQFGNNQPNNPSASTMYNANYSEQQNIGRSYQRGVGNSNNINNNNNNNHRGNDVNHSNQYKDDNMNREERYNDVSNRNNDNFSRNVNERYNSSDTNSAQGSGSGNNHRNKPRPMYFRRRKMPWGKKRYFGPKNDDNSFNRSNEPTEDQCIIVDTEGDPSVFVEDIPVLAKDKSSENDEGFIPFSNNENESNSRRNNNDIIDIGGDNYVVVDDSERGHSHSSRPGKRRMNFMSIGRQSKPRPWFKRWNRRIFPWRGPLNDNSPPSKNPRNDGQSNFQINDGIEVINEIRNNLSTLKKNKRKFDNIDDADVTGKQRKRKRMRRNRNTDASNNSIEIIDVETDNQSPVAVKKENNKANTEIKKENSRDNQQNNIQQDNDAIDKSNTDKEDDVSRISGVCNSLINNNSMDSSTSSITAITTVTVKNESRSLKQEKESCTTTILTSETFTNSTSRTNVPVKVENVSSVKIESNPAETVLSNIIIGENIKTEEELVNFKSEKSNEIVDKGDASHTFVKLEETKKEPEEPISVDIKIESNKNISNSETNNDKNVKEQNENVLNTIQQSTEVHNTLENITVQNENDNDKIAGEPEFVSWAQLKQQQQPIVNEERSELVEVSEEQENETDDEEDEIHPLITANDCKSLGTVLSALQIIGSAEFPVTNERKLKISYDVYMPNVPIKKSSRKLPNYRLVIVDFRDDLPTASEMAELNNRFEDGVPILIAIVLPDSVSFFSAATVKLPTDDGS